MSNITVDLDIFKPRPYQLPLMHALETHGYKRILAVMPRRCLSGDTQILLSNGSYKLLKDIEPGDTIMAHDGKSFVSDVVEHKWTTGIKDTCVIKSPKFLSLTTSYDHQFLTVNGSYRPIKDIKQNHKLMQYSGLNNETYNNIELASFLGYMIADGYVSHYQQPKFTNINKSILHDVERLAVLLFDVHVIWRPKGNGFDLGFSNGTKGGGAFPNPIKELFRSEGQDIPKSRKRLLKVIWSMNTASVLSFLRSYISADGSIYVQKKGFTARSSGREIPPAVDITINCGKSDELAYDIYWLLRKIGIIPRMPIIERNSNWKIHISKAEDVNTILNSGPIIGKEDKQKQALELLETRSRTRLIVKSCFITSFKRIESQPEELIDIETKHNHNFVANGYVVHNSGKDLTAFNMIIRQALMRIGTYWLVYPEYSQGRKILWDAIDNDGRTFLDYIPKEIIARSNSQLMQIRLVNGSILQVVGSDNYNSLVGTNAVGMLFSEYALQDPNCYNYLRPILLANNGFAIFISTPRGRNHLRDLYDIAERSENWFVHYKTLDDTKHIPLELIEDEIARGEMSRDMALQEYFCSWDFGVEGAYYTKYIDKLKLNGQIGDVPWDPSLKVNVAFDLGMRDKTCLVFWQNKGDIIRVIDSYSNSDVGLEHYAKYLQSKDYTWGKFFAPHDIRVRELGTGLSRLERSRQLGINFQIAPQLSLEDGIEAVRAKLPLMWFDKNKAAPVIKALENYRKEYDHKLKVYRNQPLHDDSSHFADAIRYMSLCISRSQEGTSAETLDKRYRTAMGYTGKEKDFFDGDFNYPSGGGLF